MQTAAVAVSDLPISVQFDFMTGIFTPFVDLSERRMSHLQEMYYDQPVVQEIIASDNRIIYEIRYHPFITACSDMGLGVTRLFPGKVGDEYHMTKGHFHEQVDQPEIYFCCLLYTSEWRSSLGRGLCKDGNHLRGRRRRGSNGASFRFASGCAWRRGA